MCEAADIKGSAEIFHQICKEREIQDTSLSLEEFKKSLIRLCVRRDVPDNLQANKHMEAKLDDYLIRDGKLD